MRIAFKVGCSIKSSRFRSVAGCWITGSSDRPSMSRPGVTPAASTIVGARSALITRGSIVTPGGCPGPRISSGTRIDSS